MNALNIERIEDLQEVLDALPYTSENQSEEIYHNMWCISLEPALARHVKPEELMLFLRTLIQKRRQQLHDMKVQKDILFYVWFDKQALQLRFNIITADSLSLPFRCALQILDTPDSIVSDFIGTARYLIEFGDDVQFVSKENEAFDKDGDEEKDYILNVFCEYVS